jgi:alpha-L-fucosidase
MNSRKIPWSVLCITGPLFCLSLVVPTGARAAAENSDHLKARPQEMTEWREMKFGMFVCWGPVTLTGLEIGWSRAGKRPGTSGAEGPTPIEVYDNLYKRWKPDRFDAREWVKLARAAGMKYMIFLVKHHDGFCLYDTKLTDYKSTGPQAAWQHNVMADIAAACHEAGLRLFIYYSQPDWHHPDYRTSNHARYIQYLHGQIRELLTNYGHVDGLWFDGLGGKAEDWGAANLFRMARTIQPHLIINNRCGLAGDFDTPEQQIGRFQVDRPWESCITLGTQWSWKPDDKIKTLKECIDILVRCAGGDGNLALNTNPMPDGRIEPRQVARFEEIGQWLRQYGRSIYDTRGGPFKPGPWGASTRRGNTIYVHVLAWPNEPLQLPAIAKKIVSSRLLTGGAVEVVQDEKGTVVRVPPRDRRDLDTVVELQLDGPAEQIKPCATGSGSVAAGSKITASSVWSLPDYGPDRAVDDDDSTRWGAAPGSKSGWLEVDLGGPVTIDRVVIQEAFDRIQEFELVYRQGEAWKMCLKGTTIGDNYSKRFAPVTAQYVRLNILKAKDVPTIWEFQLFTAKT